MFQKSFAALAVALVFSGAALAQNIAIVNGKPVPKARADLLMQQATRGGQQPATPEMETRVKEEAVVREIFAQEAEKRGMAANPEFRQQMELARQTLLIRQLFTDYQKKNPITDAEAQAEYDKVKAQALSRRRHRVPGSPHPGREGRRSRQADRGDQGWRQVRRPCQEEQQGHRQCAERRRPRLRQARRLRARVRQGHDRAEEGRDERAGEEPVRLPHHQARRHARSEVPAASPKSSRRSCSAWSRPRSRRSRRRCARRRRRTSSLRGSSR